MTDTQSDINKVMKSTRDLLIQKNKQYGDSALNPLGVFGSGDPITSLGARMDDKLMRLKAIPMGPDAVDTLYDLQGYLCLLIIAIERKYGVESASLTVRDDSNTREAMNTESND